MKKKESKYFVTLDGTNQLHISNGNKKTGKGIFSVNLLPGDKPITAGGQPLINVQGSCGGCCDGCASSCYAIKSCRKNNRNMISWADNTLLARYDVKKFFFLLDSYVHNNIVSIIRIHSFGEFLSPEYLRGWFDFAESHKDIKFYAYTKRFSWVEDILKEREQPENLILLASIWHGNYNNPLSLPEFIFDDGTEPELNTIAHCPAIDKRGHNTGVTCATCRKCFNAKRGDKIAVYAH